MATWAERGEGRWGQLHSRATVPSTLCPFCNSPSFVASNALAYALPDRYPVNPGHTLIVPFRHVASFFDTTLEERAAMQQLVDEIKILLDRRYRPDGYNLGVNVGDAAGQTVAHVHIHVIPRYAGDTAMPRGGVRAVIPERQSYPSAPG